MKNIICITESQNRIFYCLAKKITSSPSYKPNRFIKEVNSVKNCLPKKIINTLQDFTKNGSDKGFLLFKGFALNNEDVPPTPPDNTFSLGEKTSLAKVQALINQTCGEMIAYEAEGYGKLFQDMVPNYKLSTTQTSLGSKVELEIHTEQAFSKLRPNIISLACLRGDPHAKTYILHVSKILENVSETEKRLLREPLWKIGVDMSFKMKNESFLEGEIRGPIQILSGNEKNPQLVFDQDLMRGITDEAEALRKKLIDIYIKHRSEYILESGQVILIDNRCVVHGRSPFTAKYDGCDRFIIRSFVTLDYDCSCHARKKGSRMIQSYFS
jgi:alpha-ketoglutarate-dependent taurine dioxygenase